MVGFLIGCAIPLETFGRLSVPRRQLRYQDGSIRFTHSKDGKRLLCFLVDQENHLIYVQDQIEACLKSERLGRAIQYYLGKFNKYETGEDVGKREQLRVGA